jgi:hypothetical protein
VLAVAALAAYGAWLYRHSVRAVGGSDSSGYVNTARSILAGRIVERVRGLDELGLDDRFAPALTPLAYLPGPRPRTMSPYYPPGFPLHIAAATVLLGGSDAALFVVNPLAAALCLALMFLLARQLGLSRGWAAAGAAILGGCSVFVCQAVQPMSDVLATLWAVAAVLAALRSRQRDGWALAAGAALGIAVLVRPTNAMLALPFALALRWQRRTVALAAAGGLPFAIFYMAWNRAAYGGSLHTGYAAQMAWDLGLGFFRPRFHHYVHWVVAQLSVLVPVGWLALAGDRRAPGRDRLLLLGWFAPFLIFYCFWAPYAEWWYTRFLLPALPAMIVGALLVARDLLALLASRDGWRRLRAPAAVLLAATVAYAEWQTARQVQPVVLGNWGQKFADGCRALGREVAGRKVLVVSMEFSGAVRYYNDLAPLRWDAMSPPELATVVDRAATRGYAVYGILLSQEIERARSQVAGTWTRVAAIGDGVTIWRIAVAPRSRCPGGAAPLPETCNGVDDDCNGAVDDLARAAYSEEAVPLARLQAKNPGCNPTDESTWLACNNAFHLHCREVGCRTSGVGSLEWGAEGAATAACLTAPAARDVTSEELARFGRCPVDRPLAPPDRGACAAAVHGLCRSLGSYASGFGPVASPRPGAWSVVCLETGAAATVATTYQALADFHGGCDGPRAARETPTYCMGAAKRLCVSRGYVAGFGPVAGAETTAPTIVCLDY